MTGTVERRLAAQHLAGPPLRFAAEVVAWFGAVQAQDYPAAKWALAQRLAHVTDAELDHAFDAGELLRTHVMRPTWHFVLPADARWLIELTGPRLLAGLAGRYRRLELDQATLSRGSFAIGEALAGGRHLTRSELGDVLAAVGIAGDGQRLPHLLMHAEVTGLIISGPLRGRQHTYALLAERAPGARRLDRDEALGELARRYFLSRGPATLADFTWWSGLAAREARRGIEALGQQLGREVADGRERWFSPSAPPPGDFRLAAHLLPNFDEYTVGYRDRDAILHPDRPFDPSLFAFSSVLANVVLVGGRVAGAWHRRPERGRVRVEVRPLGALGREERSAIEAEAARYGAFLGQPVEVELG